MPAAHAVRTAGPLAQMRAHLGPHCLHGKRAARVDVRLPSATLLHKEASPPGTVASGFLPLGPTVTGFEGDDVTDHSVCYSGRKQGTQRY